MPILFPHLRRLAAFLVALGGTAALAQPLDPAFNPGVDADVFALAAQADGKILVGGNFTQIAGVARGRLARLNPDGTLDATYNPAPNAGLQSMALQLDGRLLVGGSFSVLAGGPRLRLGRLLADGTLDSAFTAGTDAGVRTIAVQPDGKILIGGLFILVNDTARTFLARLHSDGALDLAFTPQIAAATSGQTRIDAIALQPDGRILIAGTFARVNGTARPNLARLNADGTLDLTFAPGTGPSSGVQAIAVQPDGRILVGGTFTAFSGQPRRNLARLSSTGVLDSVGAIGPDGSVRIVLLLPDGRFLAAGSFNSVGTTPLPHLARFNADGSFDSTFNYQIAGAIGQSTPGIYAFVSPAAGQFVLGGTFGSVAGEHRAGLARLGSPLPTVVRPPSTVHAPAGADVTLTVTATGGDLGYQWRRNGIDVPGATHPTLALPGLSSAHTGAYTAAVTNGFGATLSSPATVAIGTPPAATFEFATLAGLALAPGRVDGTGSEARFDRPTGLAVDAAGNLWTIDAVSNFIRRITPAGAVSTLTSQAGLALAADATGRLLVADGRSRIVRIAANGTVALLAGAESPGSADGAGGAARFNSPAGIASDRFGDVFVADTANRTIRRIRPSGEVTTIAGTAGEAGTVDGAGVAARFASPRGLAFEPGGSLLVADSSALRRIDREGNVRTVATGTTLVGVAVDPAGNIYVSDSGAHVVRRLAPDGTDTIVAGAVGVAGAADGPGASTRFFAPWGLVVDSAGHLVVADNGNSTLRRGTPSARPLAVTAAPPPIHAAAGATALLWVGASGSGLSYQWKKDGTVVPAGTAGVLALPAADADAHMGYYSVVVGDGGASVESAAALLTVSHPTAPGRLVNIATRGLVVAGEALTPGFVLRGDGQASFLVRAVGPTLLRFGLGGALADPRLELAAPGGAAFAANDNWPETDDALIRAMSAAGAFALESPARDAALLAILGTATSRAYTMRVSGASATDSGLALAEVYDLSPLDAPVRLANVSTRGFVGTGSNALVPGFVIGGRGPLQLLIRAIGPGLVPFGVADVLLDPELVVTPVGRTAPVAANDNWGDASSLAAAAAAVGAFPLAAGSADAAVLLRLPPGAYTVTVNGTAGTTGNALVEVYDVP